MKSKNESDKILIISYIVTIFFLLLIMRLWQLQILQGGEYRKLAVVRSSALVEDRADSSFAGQFESFLELQSEEEFLVAVRACWARYGIRHDSHE